MREPLTIAAIPGDGIGKEVLPEGLRVLEAVEAACGIPLEVNDIGWASADHYLAHGRMMPEDWKEQLPSGLPPSC